MKSVTIRFSNDFKSIFFPRLWTGGSAGTAAGADTDTGAGGAASPADKRHGRHQKYDGNSDQQDVLRDTKVQQSGALWQMCVLSHISYRFATEELFH